MANEHDDHYRYGDACLYPSNHWALKRCSFIDPPMIAFAYFGQSDYAVYLHPEDKRGYRSVIRLIDNNRMIATLNRSYTSTERIGLALTMALVTEAYSRLVPIAQNAVAGNNAHSFDQQTGNVELGTTEEPIFLHGHVFGRGNPAEEYIENVPLDGPLPGVIFDMRAQSAHESGNERKVKWKPNEMSEVIARLKIEMRNVQETYRIHGLTIITDNIELDVYLVRHGQTDWNVQGRFQGHTDNSLNEQGEEEARQIQSKFIDVSFDQAISSDLIRARSTAEIILGPTKCDILETSPLLRERSLGSWEGCFVAELRSHLQERFDLNRFSKEEYLSLKWDDTAESYTQIYDRLEKFIRSLIISSSIRRGPILLTSHAGVIRAILYHFDFHHAFRWQVSNCAFLRLRIQTDGQITIESSEGVKLIKAEEATFPF